jgi:hypothetical protein
MRCRFGFGFENVPPNLPPAAVRAQKVVFLVVDRGQLRSWRDKPLSQRALVGVVRLAAPILA